jgi:LAO/AO transport system kinase
MDLAAAILQGDPLALSKAISLVENGEPQGRSILNQLEAKIGFALRIGLTGPPGVGKSTLVDELTSLYCARGDRVGVIAVDPTSPFTGGALLGDRIRMAKLAEREDVFMRSMATRGTGGGLARATHDAADLLDASGRNVILIETVGVGQSEVEISRGTDCVMVVLSPESGDGIQAMKSGVLEIADLLVINKADRMGADKLEYDIRSAFELGLRSRREVPILLTEAFRGKGLPELLAAIDAQFVARRADGRFEERRKRNMEDRLKKIVEHMIQRNLWESNGTVQHLSEYASDVVCHRRPVYAAAELLMKEALS